MRAVRNVSTNRKQLQSGGGLTTSALSALGKVFNKIPVGPVVNSVIDALPVELHIPGYQYCGAGTKLAKRLARGDPGINKLDQACKTHDIAYSKFSDTSRRSVADNILAQQAWERVKATDSTLGERAAALAVTAAMKAKSAVGAGYKKKKRQRRVKRGGNIRRQRKVQNKKRRNSKRTLKKSHMQGDWKMLKSGKGLYLRPYRNV